MDFLSKQIYHIVSDIEYGRLVENMRVLGGLNDQDLIDLIMASLEKRLEKMAIQQFGFVCKLLSESKLGNKALETYGWDNLEQIFN